MQEKSNLPKVPQYLTAQIQISGIKQKDIADALGYTKPNIITMFKQGLTKLPIEKVGPLAKVLGVDPVYLLRIVMNDYMPDTYNAITQIFGQDPITDNERTILKALRLATGGRDLEMKSDNARIKLSEFAKALE